MKRGISSFLIIVLLFVFGSAFSYSATAEANVIKAEYIVTESPTDALTDVEVRFENHNNLLGFKFTFQYDEQVLSPVSVSVGKNYDSGQLLSNIGVKTGSFNVIWMDLYGVNKSGTVFTLHFKRNSTKAAVIRVSYSPDDTFDDNWEPLDILCADIFLEAQNKVQQDLLVQTLVGETDANNRFDLTVNFCNNPGLLGFYLMFEYDRDVVQPLWMQPAEAFTDGQMCDTIAQNNSSFSIGWCGSQPNCSEQPAFRVRLKLLRQEPVRIKVTCVDSQTVGSADNGVSVHCESIEADCYLKSTIIQFDSSKSASLKKGNLLLLDSAGKLLGTHSIQSEQEIVIKKTDSFCAYIKPTNQTGLRINHLDGNRQIDLNLYLDAAERQGFLSVESLAKGDVNSDDVVNVLDIADLIGSGKYGKEEYSNDLNDDGVLDIADISVILSNENYSKSGVVLDASKLVLGGTL